MNKCFNKNRNNFYLLYFFEKKIFNIFIKLFKRLHYEGVLILFIYLFIYLFIIYISIHLTSNNKFLYNLTIVNIIVFDFGTRDNVKIRELTEN